MPDLEIVRSLTGVERVQGEILLGKLMEVREAWAAWSQQIAGPGHQLRPGTWDVVRTTGADGAT